eukprot:4284136-Amphidinium_carterae.1
MPAPLSPANVFLVSAIVVGCGSCDVGEHSCQSSILLFWRIRESSSKYVTFRPKRFNHSNK